jgi:hypothetical protein
MYSKQSEYMGYMKMKTNVLNARMFEINITLVITKLRLKLKKTISQMIKKNYLQNKNNIKIRQTATISQEILK